MSPFRRPRRTAGATPRGFRSLGIEDMAPLPARRAALDAVARHVATLVEAGALDGATGDVLDGLIDTWLEQWLAQLEPEAMARSAALQRLIGDAQHQAGAARNRAAASQRAYDEANAEYLLSTSGGTPALPSAISDFTPKQEQGSNGVHPGARI